MPLYSDGDPQTGPNLNEVLAPARDSTGKRVTISASHEAIRDYGWPIIWRVASAKYDARRGEPIRVTTADCIQFSRDA